MKYLQNLQFSETKWQNRPPRGIKKSVQIIGYIGSHKLVETRKETTKGYKRVTPQLFKL